MWIIQTSAAAIAAAGGMLERLHTAVDIGSSAASSADMRLACAQLVGMNAHCLLIQHPHTGRLV